MAEIFSSYTSLDHPWAEFDRKGVHHDMMPIISKIRRLPDPGTAPITRPNLADTYQRYFGDEILAPPLHLIDPYEISNWLDCQMTAALWLRWRRDELSP